MDRNEQERIVRLLNHIQQVFRGPSGWSGERNLLLAEAEKKHQEEMFRQKTDYAILMDAFLDLIFQTLQESELHNPLPDDFHRAFYLATSWRIRSSYNLFWQGYYYDAASHLRAIFENVFNYGASLRGYITKQELFEGPAAPNPPLPSHCKQNRLIYTHFERIARIAKSKMIGKDSGLSEQDQELLSIVIGTVLNSHVHRAESNQVAIFMRLSKDQRAISMLPEIDLERASLFINISLWAGWAVTRLLPFLSQPSLFSKQWKERYVTLDDAFAIFVSRIDQESSRAFERFLHSKLDFAVHQKF